MKLTLFPIFVCGPTICTNTLTTKVVTTYLHVPNRALTSHTEVGSSSAAPSSSKQVREKERKQRDTCHTRYYFREKIYPVNLHKNLFCRTNLYLFLDLFVVCLQLLQQLWNPPRNCPGFASPPYPPSLAPCVYHIQHLPQSVERRKCEPGKPRPLKPLYSERRPSRNCQ
ncbi:hypothetical protein DFP73DRAFT_270962 [Morchella snyderi]|nr:hypothetical protein DFP73DRAFT_270962 [Morchella snyderi]